MTASLWSFWNNVAQPAAARLKPGEWALLIVLGASLRGALSLSRTLSGDLDCGLDAVGHFSFRAGLRRTDAHRLSLSAR